MLLNRKQMAKKVGLSYDLLRHYERNLGNVLSLTRGSNQQVLFDSKAQELVIEAVRLKKERGYSMKQLFQHFNGTSQVDKEETAEEEPQYSVREEPKEDVKASPSPQESCDNLPAPAVGSDMAELTVLVGQFHRATCDLAERVSNVCSPDFMNQLATQIQIGVENGLAQRFATVDERMAVLAQAAQQLGMKSEGLEHQNQQLVHRNEALEQVCHQLSQKLNSLETRVHEQENKPTLSERFYRWFFGIEEKAKQEAEEHMAPAPKETTDEAAAVAPGFVRHFQRFLPTKSGKRSDETWYLDFLGPISSLKRN